MWMFIPAKTIENTPKDAIISITYWKTKEHGSPQVAPLLNHRIQKDVTHITWNYQLLPRFSKHYKIFGSTELVWFLRNKSFYCLQFIFSRTIWLCESWTEGCCCTGQSLKHYSFCSFMFICPNLWLGLPQHWENEIKTIITFVAKRSNSCC